MKYFLSFFSRLAPVAERFPFRPEAKRFRCDGSSARPLIVGLLLAMIAGGNIVSAQTTQVRADLTVLAGTVSPGSVDGTGAAARFFGPAGVALDKNGNLYVADTGNGTIRKITAGGVVTTLAGTPGGWGAVDASGAAARFAAPLHLAVDDSGNVFVADSANGAIRKINTSGAVTTFDLSAAAPAVNAPSGIAVTPDGQTVYFSDRGNNVIRRIVGNGPVTVFAGDPRRSGTADGQGSAARFYEPAGLARDAAGNLYVADSRNHTIRKITAAGAVTTLAGTAGAPGTTDAAGLAAKFYLPRAVAVDSAGNVFVADSGNHTLRRIAAGGAAVTTLAGTGDRAGSATGTGAAAQFDLPVSVAALADGTLYVADARNHAIRKITPAGVVTTFAGVAPASTDGTGAAARFRQPRALACDAAGNVYVADTLNSTIRKITTAGVATTLAGAAGVTGSTDATGAAARFNQPEGILAAADGTVYVADTLNHTIRKITTAGVVTTLAGTAGEQGDADGAGAAARLRHPQGLAFDNEGNLIVADTFNNMIRRVTPTGVVTTVAGHFFVYGFGTRDGSGLLVQFSHPAAVAVNALGEIFVADSNNGTIRKVAPGGAVSTVYGEAGRHETGDGVAGGIRFRRPTALAFDTAGNLLVADPDAETVRLIAPDGTSHTIAGRGDVAGSLGGAGPAARLAAPHGVAVAPGGIIYIADSGNHVIRRGAVMWATPPAFTQQPTKVAGATPLTFTVQASTGNGVLNYRWQFQPKWGSWTDCSTDPMFGGAGTSTLTIPGMTAGHNDWMIRCLIDNGYSTVVASAEVRLWMSGDNTVRINGDSSDVELIVAVTRLAGADRPNTNWGSSWGIVDGVGAAAKFSGPRGVAIDAAGIGYVADASGGTIRKVLPDGTVTTLAGKAGTAAGEGWGNSDGAGVAARFAGPQALAFAPDGTLVVADTDNGTLRRVTPAGVVTTLTDGSGQPYRFRRPQGVAVDTLGTIYVSDTDDFTVRKIAADGVVSLVAGRSLVSGLQDGAAGVATFGSPTALAVDPAGRLHVVDRANHTIRRIAADGSVTTIAGSNGSAGTDDGFGNAARFNGPAGLAIDSRGVLYVADTGNHAVRQIDPDGRVRTIAGRKPMAQDRGFGDVDGAGSRFWNPWGIACDNRGNLLVTDAGNSKVRHVATRLPAVGETISFAINTNGNPGGFQWQAQAPGTSTWTNLTTGGAYTATGGGDAGRLSVVLAALHDGYRFRCHVSRGFDNTHIDGRAAVVAVGIAPTITTQPAAKSGTAGQSVNFTVVAKGTPAAFAYRWQRKPAGTSTSWGNLVDGPVYRGTGTATLTLAAVDGVMNGDQFRCVVDNYVASAATSAAATLTASGVLHTDFASWKAGYAVVGGANDDPSGSGVTNLERYAFGLASSGAVTTPVVLSTLTAGSQQFLQIGFKRKAVATDIRYVIQFSSDLVTWTTLRTIEPGWPVDVLEQDSVAIGSVPRRFLRVKIEPRP